MPHHGLHTTFDPNQFDYRTNGSITLALESSLSHLEQPGSMPDCCLWTLVQLLIQSSWAFSLKITAESATPHPHPTHLCMDKNVQIIVRLPHSEHWFSCICFTQKTILPPMHKTLSLSFGMITPWCGSSQVLTK